jgi:nickel-dependent lactate racemase
MRIAVHYGREQAHFEVAAERLIASRPPPRALVDRAAAVRDALEHPVGFVPLRRALTPDDHVVVVVDERLPHLVELLVPLLEHIVAAGVTPEAVTLVCPPSASGQRWTDELPESLEEVRLEEADPADRGRLSYLATTREGRRLYMSRTVVDADQVVVLSGCRYDPLLGTSGAEGALYPALSDSATRTAVGAHVNLDRSPQEPWPIHVQAEEAAWLLGAPFFLQVIEAAGDDVAAVVAGTTQASAEARRQLDAAWRLVVNQPADVVVAALSGDPTRHTFTDLAAALDSAAHVVRPGGRIALLTQAQPSLDAQAALLQRAEDVQEALAHLPRQPTLEQVAAVRWARAVRHAQVALLSQLPDETAEELFVTPLKEASQVQRLLDAVGSCLFLADAHKTQAILAEQGDR